MDQIFPDHTIQLSLLFFMASVASFLSSKLIYINTKSQVIPLCHDLQTACLHFDPSRADTFLCIRFAIFHY